MIDVRRIKKLLCLKNDDLVKVRDYFGKSANDVKQDISIIREWLKQQPHLPDDEGDERLERFLICNKFSLEETKRKLENCYTFRSLYPEVMDFYDVRGEIYKNALKSYIIVPLPNMTEKMERIVFIKKLQNPDFNPYDFFTACMILEILQTYDFSLKFIFIMDNGTLTFDDVKKVDLLFIQKSVQFVNNCICATFQHAFYINAPPFFDVLLKLFKLVMKPKLFARFSVHSSIESVRKILPNKFLPIELGGENGSIDKLKSEWLNLIDEAPNVFKKIAERKSKEQFRIGDANANELFGIAGSFKKLNLD